MEERGKLDGSSIDQKSKKRIPRMIRSCSAKNPVLDKANDAKHLTSQSIPNGTTYSLLGPGPRLLRSCFSVETLYP
jgi:hypothetical protein